MVDLELIHKLEIDFVRRPEDGVCDVPSAILVMPSAILSLTPIDTRRKIFCRSALSCASLLFAITGSVVLLLVLARLAAALDAASTSLFFIWTIDLYLSSALLRSLPSAFILSAESSYNCLSRIRSICVRSVFASLYA